MSGDVTIGALKRISFDPNNDNVGPCIGGQNYWDVWFTGGEAQNLRLVNCTLIPSGGGGGVSSENIVTSGTTTTGALNQFVGFNSATSGNKTVSIPESAGTLNIIIIGDIYGNAGTYPITPVPVSGSIINALAAQVYTNGGSVTLIDTELGWFAC